MPRSVHRTAEWCRVPLSVADRLTLAVLGTFVVALLVGLALGVPPEIHP